MRRSRSVSFSVLSTLFLVCLATSAARAQFTYGSFLEPPEGKILQGMGQWDADNAAYLSALAGYGSPPYPGHEMAIVNIPPSESSAGGNRPFDATAAAIMLGNLEDMDEDGRIPAVAISFYDYTAGGGTPTSHDDEVAAETNADMVSQINRLGDVLEDFGKPVFVRIGLEINNVTLTGYAEGYHAYDFPICYQITHDLLIDAGATRCAFVWCWEASAPTDYLDVHPTTGDPKWYPGDEYVDWFGLDIFNRNEFTELSSPITAAGSKLSNVLAFIAKADEHQKPIFIAESSCVDFPIAESATDDNDSWDEWFVHYFDFIENNPGIKAIDYISHDWTGGSGGPDNWLDGNLYNCDEVMDNWVDAISEPEFLGADSQLLLNGYTGWWGLNFGKNGAGGLPLLSGTGTVLPSASVSVSLSGAMASKPAVLFVGASAIYASFKGGTLVPNPDVSVFLTTNGSGGHTYSFTWPSMATPGTTFYFQYWIKEQNSPEFWAASNAIKGVTL